jgi:hypothetical protein
MDSFYLYSFYEFIYVMIWDLNYEIVFDFMVYAINYNFSLLNSYFDSKMVFYYPYYDLYVSYLTDIIRTFFILNNIAL